MQLGLILDISSCGSDCYGKLNNPVSSTIKFVDCELNVKKEFQHYIVPEESITYSAMAMHGITIDSINSREDKIDLETYLKTVYSILKKSIDKGVYLIGFNSVSFDLGILNKHFVSKLHLEPIKWPDGKVVDILSLAEKSTDFREIGNYTIDACLMYFCRNNAEFVKQQMTKRHSSENDAVSEIEILRNFMIEHEMKSFEELVEFQNKIREFTVFSWGKYKGMTAEQVFKIDNQYLNWCKRNNDVKTRHPNLIEKIDKLYLTM